MSKLGASCLLLGLTIIATIDGRRQRKAVMSSESMSDGRSLINAFNIYRTMAFYMTLLTGDELHQIRTAVFNGALTKREVYEVMGQVAQNMPLQKRLQTAAYLQQILVSILDVQKNCVKTTL